MHSLTGRGRRFEPVNAHARTPGGIGFSRAQPLRSITFGWRLVRSCSAPALRTVSSKRSAASWSMPSNSWPYTSKTVLTDVCPRRRATTGGCSPCLTNKAPWECRSEWKVTPSRLSGPAAGLQDLPALGCGGNVASILVLVVAPPFATCSAAPTTPPAGACQPLACCTPHSTQAAPSTCWLAAGNTLPAWQSSLSRRSCPMLADAPLRGTGRLTPGWYRIDHAFKGRYTGGPRTVGQRERSPTFVDGTPVAPASHAGTPRRISGLSAS